MHQLATNLQKTRKSKNGCIHSITHGKKVAQKIFDKMLKLILVRF